MGVGATIKVIKRFVHPSELIREKYNNPKKGERLEGCLVIGKEEKLVGRRQQTCIVFRHDEFDNMLLHAVERYCSIVTEGPETGFFVDEFYETSEETFIESASVENEREDLDTEQMNVHRQGGEIDILELAMAGLVVENDNDPLYENLPTTIEDNANEECVYSGWGHSGICARRQVVSQTIMPTIKVQNKNVESFNRVDLFELFFVTEYVKEVILVHVNKNIKGEEVTYGEFLRWLGIWFLIASVIGPKRDAFS